MIRHVAIVGGGYSGTLAAINLLRHEAPRVTLIEKGERAGLGLAYGAAHPSHLLNVRASGMSAFPDDADHFVRWLSARGEADPAHAFAPRVTYGAYLRELLDEAVTAAGDRIRLVRGEVVDATAHGDGARLMLSDGTTIDADAAVLAVGNLPPADLPGLMGADALSDRYKPDPWDPSVAEGLGPDDEVLVIGTGLTMVDVALLLEARGFTGRITAVSRRGLLPQAHAAVAAAWERSSVRPGTRASDLLHRVRERSGEVGWRNAVDELRPFTQAMWAEASEAERARFLRHLRPWWDIHRHRLAPQIAERMDAMRARGQLRVLAGKTIAFEEEAGGIAVTWRPRGAEAVQRMTVARVVNCTGPLSDLRRTADPLLARLQSRGVIRGDAAHIGIDVDGDAHTIAADGHSNPWLSALGPMTRGAVWEIVAVPDIRGQARDLADRLATTPDAGGSAR